MEKTVTMQLHPREANLIEYIRNRFKYGTIEIVCYDGLPKQIRKYVELQSLDEKFDTQTESKV